MVAKKIKHIGEKRKRLSEIFSIRNSIVDTLNFDDPDAYNRRVEELRRTVNALESA